MICFLSSDMAKWYLLGVIMHGKNAPFVFLGLAMGLLSGCASLQHPGEEWFARDKAQHFTAAALISAGSAYALSEAGAEDAPVVNFDS